MAHYALLNAANEVTKVITGVDESDTSNLPSEFSSWEEFYADQHNAHSCKRTSYNTHGGQHLLGGTPFRANYAGQESVYDASNDVFYSKQPYNFWTLDSDWVWQPPVAYPSDANSDLSDTSIPGKIYAWVDASYAIDNTKGWVLIATFNYNSETEEWELE